MSYEGKRAMAMAQKERERSATGIKGPRALRVLLKIVASVIAVVVVLLGAEAGLGHFIGHSDPGTVSAIGIVLIPPILFLIWRR